MKRVVIVFILGLVILISACNANTGKVVDTVNTCEDSDGDDVMTRGTVTYYDPIARQVFAFEDECISPHLVKEGLCMDGTFVAEREFCHPSIRCQYGHCRTNQF